MSSPAAFLSYARKDDELSEGHVSELRMVLEREMKIIRGESDFRIFQDQEDVTWGQQWKNRIDESIDGSSLLIPIISPFFFRRQACRDELKRFLKRESQLGRDDLILPIYFIDVPNFTVDNQDELIVAVAKRQYRDWRDFRHEDLKTSESKKRISILAREMDETLSRQPTPQERRLHRSHRLHDRLAGFHKRIGGPLRKIPILERLAEQLRAANIDSLERLLIRSEQDLQEAGFTEEIVRSISQELSEYGHKLRDPRQEPTSIDQLVLTPCCRNALRQAEIETVDDLVSKSANDLMLTGRFLPEHVEEVSLRLQVELERNLRETDERPLTFDDILARRGTRQ